MLAAHDLDRAELHIVNLRPVARMHRRTHTPERDAIQRDEQQESERGDGCPAEVDPECRWLAIAAVRGHCFRYARHVRLREDLTRKALDLGVRVEHAEETAAARDDQGCRRRVLQLEGVHGNRSIPRDVGDPFRDLRGASLGRVGGNTADAKQRDAVDHHRRGGQLDGGLRLSATVLRRSRILCGGGAAHDDGGDESEREKAPGGHDGEPGLIVPRPHASCRRVGAMCH
jgi:hypothetical protein